MELLAIKGTNLNTTVYRGFASIKDIAAISAPDTYKQDSNPNGLQRNLNERHSRAGYRYAELPQISRTDGNHRLFFGEGDPALERPPLDISSPFSLTVGLTPIEEASLFVDINDNLMRMNTSHLQHLLTSFTDSQMLASKDPA